MPLSNNAEECDHVRSPFSSDKLSHVIKIVDVWRRSQPPRLSLNSRSTCFGGKLSNVMFKQSNAYLSRACVPRMHRGDLTDREKPNLKSLKNSIKRKNLSYLIDNYKNCDICC